MRSTRSIARAAALAGAVMLAGAVAVGCAINPATGKRQLSLISESQEIEIGRESDGMIVDQMGLYGGAGLQDYVQRIGDSLAAVSERPNLDWTFRVVDDPTVNAFALPGGYIYITRGIMAHLDSEAELATVVGHEIGHVTARHGVNQMSKAQLAQLGLGLGSVLSPEVARYGQYAQMGVGLMFLKFGRDDERQSDDLGLRYVVAAGYDPRQSPGVFDMLDRVSEEGGGGGVPNWLSTHPAPENREARLSQQVAGLGQDFSRAKVGRQEYFAHIDGMVYGVDPREGYFRDDRFFHPELEFRFDFPQGWTTTNLREAVIGQSSEKDAIVRITMATGTSPDQALAKFMDQEGVYAGSSWRNEIQGYATASRYFSASTQQGSVRGLVAYLQHGTGVYQLLAYTLDSRWGAYSNAIESSIGSFDRLTDPDALAVEPARLRIVEPTSNMSLEQFARTTGASIPIAKLALINRLDPSARVEAGKPYKTVTGGLKP